MHAIVFQGGAEYISCDDSILNRIVNSHATYGRHDVRGKRNHRTSIGGEVLIGSKPANWRRREKRPSAPTVRVDRTSCHPPRPRYRIPHTTPFSTIVSWTLAPITS